MADGYKGGRVTEPFGLQTERLRLRRLDLDDAGLMLAVWNDPAFVRHVGDRRIRTVDEARQTLTDTVLRLYADHGHGPYRVALLSGDIPIGICGLFRRDGLDDVDIGFALLPEYRGRGYAHESAQAVVLHARDDLGLDRLTAIVAADNAASIGLIEKLGLSFERVVPASGEDRAVRLYAMRL